MEIETHVPITEAHGFTGFGHWDRRRESCPPLDFWARDDCDLHRWGPCQRTLAGSTVKIPDTLQRGFGNMHLDDWFPPDELIRPVSEGDKRMMQLLTIDNNNWMEMKAPVEANAVFESKLNVHDFHPHELQVKICFGLVTIQGQHEEDTKSDGEHDRWGHEIKSHGQGHMSRRFKRTFTLPETVAENQLQCKLTRDGHLILCAPVVLAESKLRELELDHTDATVVSQALPATSCKEEEQKQRTVKIMEQTPKA